MPAASANSLITTNSNPSVKQFIRYFSKIVALATLFLIFVGGLVTSTGSGLAVPDWPLSYGSLFPPMVGGVFYEHGHRMVAATVGFMSMCLTILLLRYEERRWVKRLGIAALAAVIAQGILGGLTVKFFLPPPVSVAHAVLAQTFFILTIIIAYSQSKERERRLQEVASIHPSIVRWTRIVVVVVYLQLIIGAVMRHTASGLAIPDFPKMGGYWWPPLNEEMLQRINDWRFEMNMDPVHMGQVVIHLLHRVGAVAVCVSLCVLTVNVFKKSLKQSKLVKMIYFLNFLVAIQIVLGAFTVLTRKEPHLTSLHVMIGAGILGTSALFFLQTAPLKWDEFKKMWD